MIITTTAELIKFVEAGSLTDFSSISPSIRTVERRHLVPVLGDAEYAGLLTAYAANPHTFTAKQQALFDLCQEAVANLAMAVAISRLAVTISDSGVRRSESDSLKSAFQYQERNARESFTQSGFDALEDVLKYLDANKADFTDWATGPAYADYKTYFIQSAVEFSKYYDIRESRLIYLTIRPAMRQVENFYLKDVLGAPLFAALKAGQLAGDLSDEYQALLSNFICPAVALHSMAKAIMQHSLSLDENGVSINLIGRNINIDTKEQAMLDKFQAMQNELQDQGDYIFRKLGEELAANPTLYPDFTAPIVESSLMNITNKQCNSFYGV